MHSFPNANNSVRFNRQGTRLVCKESNKLPVVYNVPIGSGAVNGKVEFSAPGYGIPGYGRHALCFAGQKEELVVAASADHGLYVWSLPNDQWCTQSLTNRLSSCVDTRTESTQSATTIGVTLWLLLAERK